MRALGLALIGLAAAGCGKRAAPPVVIDALPVDTLQRDASAGPPDTRPDTVDPCPHPKVEQSCANGWCRIPAGCFYMGSPEDEPCRDGGELRHRVTLTHDFDIAETEVTVDQYKTLISSYHSYGNLPDSAVGNLTWHEAAAYCNALSTSAGLTPCYTCSGLAHVTVCSNRHPYDGAGIYDCPGYRLPTEAEWEYAYRAGTSTAYYSGPNNPKACEACGTVDANLSKIAWYCSSSLITSSTTTVAKKQPNGWGLYDMAGNAWEWVHDWYGTLPKTPVTDPAGPASGTDKLLRGGSYGANPKYLRAATRKEDWPHAYFASSGFRCARTR